MLDSQEHVGCHVGKRVVQLGSPVRGSVTAMIPSTR